MGFGPRNCSSQDLLLLEVPVFGGLLTRTTFSTSTFDGGLDDDEENHIRPRVVELTALRSDEFSSNECCLVWESDGRQPEDTAE